MKLKERKAGIRKELVALLAIGKAREVVLWPTPGFKRKVPVIVSFSAERTFISTSAVTCPRSSTGSTVAIMI